MNNKSSETLVKNLSGLLADTYILCLKTQNYHWNVTGSHFPSYHLFFETQYEALFQAGDAIAERIRVLGYPAPGSYSAFAKLTSLTEEVGTPSAQEMIKNLTNNHGQVIDRLKEVLTMAQEIGDEGTADFLVERLRDHEKTLWMLQSSLE